MSSCTPTPTATQFTTITTDSVSTSFTSSVTTLPGSVTTIQSVSCIETATASTSGGAAGGCLSSTTILVTSTIPGSVSTEQVPVLFTNHITTTQATATLFATCPTDGGSTSPTDPPTSPPTSPTPPPTNSTTTPTTPTAPIIPSNTTPPANSQQAQPTGSATITQTLPGTTIIQTVPLFSTQPTNGAGGSSSGNSKLGPILGGVFGGVAGVAIIVGVIWYILRRRSRWDDIFDEKEGYDDVGADGIRRTRSRGHMLDTEFAAPDSSSEPKPYSYGLVGSARAMSPPSENVGMLAMDNPLMHTRSLSETPLILGAAAAAGTGAAAGHLLTPSSGTGQSRPSTRGSSYFPGGGPNNMSDTGHSVTVPTSHSGHGYLNGPPSGSSAAFVPPPIPAPSSPPAGAGSRSAGTPTEPTSPTRSESLLGSPVQHQRTLFVANQLDADGENTPPQSPAAGSSFVGAAVAAGRASGEKGKGKRRENASVTSVTSGGRQSQDLAGRGPGSPRQPVIVHKDGGRADTGAGSTSPPVQQQQSGLSGNNSKPGEAPPPAYME